MQSDKINWISAKNLLEHSTIAHGFFTRNGGNSKGDYASLNAGYYCGDNTLAVYKNRQKIIHSFSPAFSTLITLKQVAGGDVVVVDSNYFAKTLNHQNPLTTGEHLYQYAVTGDALITRMPSVFIGILTADCVPILVADPITQTVAAIHAGYAGLLAGVIQNTVNILSNMGCKVANLTVAIGPHIQQKDYQVDQQIYDKFVNLNKNYSQYFLPDSDDGVSGNKYSFDLGGVAQDILHAIGVTNIYHTGYSTYSSPEMFFSHRYSTHHQIKRGVQLSGIGLYNPSTN